jgi:hypothetical protein
MAPLTLRGIVRGNSIELERESGLPSGARVTVRIEAEAPAAAAQPALLDGLCGAWSEDETLPAVFREVRRRRSRGRARPVDLDAAS